MWGRIKPGAPPPDLLVSQNEAQVGEAIREEGVPREEVFITSKIAPFQQGTTAARKSIASSLANLQVTSSNRRSSYTQQVHQASHVWTLLGIIHGCHARAVSFELGRPCLMLNDPFESQTDFLDLCLIHWPGASRVASTSPENARLRHETCVTCLLHRCLCLTLSTETFP